jgi:hypothetical protein
MVKRCPFLAMSKLNLGGMLADFINIIHILYDPPYTHFSVHYLKRL